VLPWLTATAVSLLGGIAAGWFASWTSLLLFDTGSWTVLLFACVAFGVAGFGQARIVRVFRPSMVPTSVPSKRAWWLGCLVLVTILVWV
jgi:uncharacterized membrane protein (UPF0136 family)